MTSDPFADNYLVVIGLSTAVIVLVAAVILRAARYEMPVLVVLALTLLGSLALVGYGVGGEFRPELGAIAGTAIGALAGGVTAILTKQARQAQRDEDNE